MSAAREYEKASGLLTQVSMSDDWELSSWPASDLTMARAGLKHMLSLIEKAMGERGLMAPQRGTR